MMRQAVASTMPMIGTLAFAMSPARTVRLVIDPVVGENTSVLLSRHCALAISAVARLRAAWWATMLLCAFSMAIWDIFISAVVRRNSSLALSSSARGAYVLFARSA